MSIPPFQTPHTLMKVLNYLQSMHDVSLCQNVLEGPHLGSTRLELHFQIEHGQGALHGNGSKNIKIINKKQQKH